MEEAVEAFLSVASEPGDTPIDLPMPAARAIRAHILSSSERVKELEGALKAAAGTCQVFLDDCGDVRDFTTQADINDWLELLNLLPAPRS